LRVKSEYVARLQALVQEEAGAGNSGNPSESAHGEGTAAGWEEGHTPLEEDGEIAGPDGPGLSEQEAREGQLREEALRHAAHQSLVRERETRLSAERKERAEAEAREKAALRSEMVQLEGLVAQMRSLEVSVDAA